MFLCHKTYYRGPEYWVGFRSSRNPQMPLQLLPDALFSRLHINNARFGDAFKAAMVSLLPSEPMIDQSRFLFSQDENDAADDSDDEGEGKVGNQGKRNSHVFCDTIGRKCQDEEHLSEPQAADGHWNGEDEEDDRNKDEVVEKRDFQMEGSACQVIMEDNIDLEEQCPKKCPVKRNSLFSVNKDEFTKFERFRSYS